LENYTVVATDVGDEKRSRDMDVRVVMPLAIIEKRRIGNTGRTEAMNVIGEVEGRNVLILDDEIDTAGTILEAVRVLRANGCQEVIVSGYHAVFSGPAIERLRGAEVREIVVTDSLPVPESKRLPNMTIIPVAALLGDAIGRIHSGQSVGALFQ
jgi:ribose-phosphate pyrophosphokinase